MLKMIFFCTIIGLQFFIMGPSHAGISVDPALLELSAPKEEQLQGSLWVTNEGNEAVEIEAQPEYWLKDKPLINGQAVEISSWLNLEPKDFKLGPAERKEVKYSIKLPSGLDGEIMAQIYFADVTGKGTGAVNLISRLGVGMYVSAKETQKISAKIDAVNIIKGDREIKFEVVVENSGNVHLRPKGKLIIEDDNKTVVKEMETQYGWPVFPANKYSYYAFCKIADIKSGRYKLKAVIDYGNLYEPKADNKTNEKTLIFEMDKYGQITINKT